MKSEALSNFSKHTLDYDIEDILSGKLDQLAVKETNSTESIPKPESEVKQEAYLEEEPVTELQTVLEPQIEMKSESIPESLVIDNEIEQEADIASNDNKEGAIKEDS